MKIVGKCVKTMRGVGDILIRPGDLVRYVHPNECCDGYWGCFFCQQQSNCMGIIMDAWIDSDDERAVNVQFDVGEWSLRGAELGDLEVLSTLEAN